MPDLGPAIAGLLDLLKPVLGPLVSLALRTMARSALGMLLGAIATSCAAYAIAERHGLRGRGLVAVVITVGAFGVLGAMLAVKRAVGRALAHALGPLGVGQRVVALLFDDLLGVADEGAAGTRGHAAQRGVERLPLVEIEQRLRGLISRLTGAGEGFFVGRVRAALLDKVATFTVAELRAEGEAGGGIDLVRARDRVQGRVNEKLGASIEAALSSTTAWMVGLAVAISLGGAFLVG